MNGHTDMEKLMMEVADQEVLQAKDFGLTGNTSNNMKQIQHLAFHLVKDRWRSQQSMKALVQVVAFLVDLQYKIVIAEDQVVLLLLLRHQSIIHVAQSPHYMKTAQ